MDRPYKQVEHVAEPTNNVPKYTKSTCQRRAVHTRPLCGRLSVGKGYFFTALAGRGGDVSGLFARLLWPLALMLSTGTEVSAKMGV